MRRIACLAVALAGASAAGAAVGADAADEHRAARAWVDAAFLARAPARRSPPPGIEVRRQDYGAFRFNRSVLDTPLRLGDKDYARGLGTHSVSDIVVRLPRAGERFEAEAGVDRNHDTRGEKGSVVFAVEVAGREAFRSGVRRGADGPLSVRVDLGGAKEFVLHVLDAGDGPGWDQSDWAEARVMLDNGETLWLDEMKLVAQGTGLSAAIPFSFTYGGRSSAELLPSWKRAHEERPARDGREVHAVTWTDPETGLAVTAEVTLFAGFPAADAVLRFTNSGAADSPLIENILPLDLRVGVGKESPVTLHHAHGSSCGPNDFLPIDQAIPVGTDLRLAPDGGRSSNGRFPFFNLEWPGGGAVGAIGWSGQWEMRVRRDEAGVSVCAGQEAVSIRLRPGESIRTPRILLVMWQGDDALRGTNLLRRLLLAHYVPRLAGEPVIPPVTQNTWFVYNTGNDVTEANQLDIIRAMAPMGVEAYWLDAGWFEGGWPSGVGSWVPRADAFPRGLRPLGDAAHALGMKFVLWFEPERVHPQSRIGREHPEFVLRRDGGDGLYNLGDPAARKWLTDHLSKCIAEWGIDVYRNDFNIDPLPFWRAADAPDRRGITEIRYVEGLYAMWDELLARHPGLAIDNCASGGRRIDIEMISRSYPLWKSDTQCCGHALPVQDQVQTAGISLYVPLHSAGVWGFAPYTFRSVATTGANVCPDTRVEGFPADLERAAIAEAKGLRELYLGDYYPLTEVTLDDRQWIGWQFDRPELGRGFAVFFRRPKSPYAALDARLRGLDAKAVYDIRLAEDYGPGRALVLSGEALSRLRVEIGSAPGSVLVTYRKRGR